MASALLTQPGIGPISAAQVLISWSHPGRFRSEAAFAMLAGAAPVEASLGQVVRHRLNRGGDRQLNRALHTIVMLRQVHHGPTRAYTSRRIGQGKSQREIRRCLKRSLARQLYRLLERTATTDPWALGWRALAGEHRTRVTMVRVPGRNVAVPLTSQTRGCLTLTASRTTW